MGGGGGGLGRRERSVHCYVCTCFIINNLPGCRLLRRGACQAKHAMQRSGRLLELKSLVQFSAVENTRWPILRCFMSPNRLIGRPNLLSITDWLAQNGTLYLIGSGAAFSGGFSHENVIYKRSWCWSAICGCFLFAFISSSLSLSRKEDTNVKTSPFINMRKIHLILFPREPTWRVALRPNKHCFYTQDLNLLHFVQPPPPPPPKIQYADKSTAPKQWPMSGLL